MRAYNPIHSSRHPAETGQHTKAGLHILFHLEKPRIILWLCDCDYADKKRCTADLETKAHDIEFPQSVLDAGLDDSGYKATAYVQILITQCLVDFITK